MKYAWGENELKPITRRGHSAGIFGESKQGATIVDSMDTLYLMGMVEEFDKGRQWIEKNLEIKNLVSTIDRNYTIDKLTKNRNTKVNHPWRTA